MTTVTKSLDADSSEARRKAALLALYGGMLVLAGKLVAAILTGSTAVLSDALESIVNVVTAAFLVYSVRLAATPADRNHPYGHGKIEFFAAGVEGSLIGVAGIMILYAAALALWRGPQIQQLDLGMAILAGFGAINLAIGLVLIRVGRRVDSLALRADGMHLLTDVLTTVGVLVGLLGVKLTGWTTLDPLIAIAVAINILHTGWQLGREGVRGLMDEADLGLLSEITSRLEAGRGDWCIDVHGLRAWRSGASNHIDFHVTIPRYYDAERLHEIDEILTEAAFEDLCEAGDVIIHFDPCRPRQCSSCRLENCPVRTSDFVERPAFEVANLTRADEDLDDGSPLGELR